MPSPAEKALGSSALLQALGEQAQAQDHQNDGQTHEQGVPGRTAQIGLGFREHPSQRSIRRLNADAQIAHAGLRQNGVVKADGDDGQQDLDSVGQDMPENDPQVAGPHEAGGGDVIQRPLLGHLAPDHAGKRGDEQNP